MKYFEANRELNCCLYFRAYFESETQLNFFSLKMASNHEDRRGKSCKEIQLNYFFLKIEWVAFNFFYKAFIAFTGNSYNLQINYNKLQNVKNEDISVEKVIFL